jgi:hypothetical protein
MDKIKAWVDRENEKKVVSFSRSSSSSSSNNSNTFSEGSSAK